MSQEFDFLRLFVLLFREKKHTHKTSTILYEMHILLTVDHFNTYVRRNGLENRSGAPNLFHFQYKLRGFHRAFFFASSLDSGYKSGIKSVKCSFSPPKPSLHPFLSLCSFSVYHFPSGSGCPDTPGLQSYLSASFNTSSI